MIVDLNLWYSLKVLGKNIQENSNGDFSLLENQGFVIIPIFSLLFAK